MKVLISKLLRKIAMPHVIMKEGLSVDFYVEDLDNESFRDMIDDFKAGEVLSIFVNIIGDATRKVSRNDFSEEEVNHLLHVFEQILKQKKKLNVIPPTIRYDKEHKQYVRLKDKEAIIKECLKKDKDDRPESLQKWCLYTRDGDKLLGRHPSKQKALKQERVIQVMKHKGS